MEGSKLPFEFVGEIAGAGAMAKASDIEGGAATGHCVWMWDGDADGRLADGGCK